MPAEWIEEKRRRELERALASPEFTDEQRRTMHRLNEHWVLRGRKTATRNTKVRMMRDFAKHCKKPFEQATREDIQTFLSKVASTCKENTIEGYKRVLKSTYKDLLNPEEPGHPKVVSWIRMKDPMKLVKPIRRSDLLTPDEIKAIAAATTHPRDRALVMVLYDSGVRISELLSLHVRDVEFDQYGAQIHIEDGKTGSRPVRLIYSVADLQAWINNHPFKNEPERPLFLGFGDSDWGRPLMHGGATLILKNAAKKAAIKKHVWNHLLRHSNVTEWGPTLVVALLKGRASWRLLRFGGVFMAKFAVRDGGPYIDGKRIERGWESWNGWYWFGVEVSHYQDSIINGREYENDPIWFGLVQGHEEEWGHWSQTELEILRPKVWEIKKQDLPYAGRRC